MSHSAPATPAAGDDRPLGAMAEKAKQDALIALAMGIAHDFNNHLTAILGNNSIVLRHLPAQSPVRKNAAQIEASALQALELAAQLQLFTGRVRPALAALDLSASLREMEAELRAMMIKDVALELRLDAHLPLVKADLQQVRCVVTNLLQNASDAMADRQGTVVLATGAMDVDKKVIEQCRGEERMKEGRHAFILVADSGRGMTPEVQSRIFDPFYSARIRGKGLGLAVVLGIVRGHGGGIRVESEPNKGSTFRILLPAI